VRIEPGVDLGDLLAVVAVCLCEQGSSLLGERARSGAIRGRFPHRPGQRLATQPSVDRGPLGVEDRTRTLELPTALRHFAEGELHAGDRRPHRGRAVVIRSEVRFEDRQRAFIELDGIARPPGNLDDPREREQCLGRDNVIGTEELFDHCERRPAFPLRGRDVTAQTHDRLGERGTG